MLIVILSEIEQRIDVYAQSTRDDRQFLRVTSLDPPFKPAPTRDGIVCQKCRFLLRQVRLMRFSEVLDPRSESTVELGGRVHIPSLERLGGCHQSGPSYPLQASLYYERCHLTVKESP